MGNAITTITLKEITKEAKELLDDNLVLESAKNSVKNSDVFNSLQQTQNDLQCALDLKVKQIILSKGE